MSTARAKNPATRKPRVERIKIVIENIDDRWFFQIDGGDICGGFRGETAKASVYVAISDYLIAKARIINDKARAQLA